MMLDVTENLGGLVPQGLQEEQCRRSRGTVCPGLGE